MCEIFTAQGSIVVYVYKTFVFINRYTIYLWLPVQLVFVLYLLVSSVIAVLVCVITADSKSGKIPWHNNQLITSPVRDTSVFVPCLLKEK